MAEIIVPQAPVNVNFTLDQTRHFIASLSLLDMAEQFSGLGDWVYQTLKVLTADELRAIRLALHDINVYLGHESWPSFPDWLDHIARQDATEMRDRALATWIDELTEKDGGETPSAAELLGDRDLFLSLAKKSDGADHDPAYWETMYSLLNDPPRRQRFIVGRLHDMWDRFLVDEWRRCLPALEESIAAFESLDMSGLTVREALQRVVLRAQLPPEGLGWLSGLETLNFVPSLHTGPYLIHFSGPDSTTAWFVYGARIPEGVSTPTPALNRSELLMRLTALANDTRLSILELLAKEGELGTPDVVSQLHLSQSAAARHLEHLAATGYLATRRRQGTNLFRLNPDQIDQTFEVLKELFG